MISLNAICKICRKFIKRSPWIFHINTGSCNGCDIELVAALTPRYDAERFGAILVGSPRHADILAITGPVTEQQRERLMRIYQQTPDPKVVIAIGTCTMAGSVFFESPVTRAPLDKHIPVDVFVPGCPPRPEAILDGIIKALQIYERKLAKQE
ncbi:MAG: NADH-quinone oxidoreductase subunit B family protein [Euryarchaeota archaeon]|nr:NADH-quinone oxidoreductase subunit B family protein [Euryarchaeota archaeon]MCD6158400.1 NADH-quinone oxidoreductase subunit B family protein [Euryarchaeota archaeon]